MDSRHPLKSIKSLEDIVTSAIFLLKNKSIWIALQAIGIDGGLSTLNIH